MINQLPAFFDARHMTKRAGRLFLAAEHTIKDYLVKIILLQHFSLRHSLYLETFFQR